MQDALHLLRVYQTIIALRPLDRGNREFLETLLRACRALLAPLQTHLDGAGAADTGLHELVHAAREQTAANAAAAAPDLLTRISTARAVAPVEGRSLYVQRPISHLRDDYASVRIVFGPGLGMGDAITFYPFVRALLAHCSRAAVTIWDLYPSLWRHLVPEARTAHYRGRPLRPFTQPPSGEGGGRTLVVIIDFEGFSFHERILPRRPDQDVLEIALGRRTAWFAPGDSPWTDVDHFARAPVANNYWMLHQLALRLFGSGRDVRAWMPREVRRRRTPSVDGPVVLLNPLSSKAVPLTLDDWSRLFRQLRVDVDTRGQLRAIVYPGVHEASRADAAALARALRTRAGVLTELLSGADGEPLTPYNAIDRFIHALRHADICLTIDTFSAHLAPLYGVPTLVITLKRNREFWVPDRQTFHWLAPEAVTGIPPVAARLLRGAHTDGPRALARREAARGLVAATDRALGDPSSARELPELYRALAVYHGFVEPSSGLREEGARWLRYWSRLSTAARRHPLDAANLLTFVQQWELSGFFKCAALDAYTSSRAVRNSDRASTANAVVSAAEPQ